MQNAQVFFNTYAPILAAACNAPGARYVWPANEAQAVACRMVYSLATGGAMHDTPPIRATCKALNVRHTGKAIREYLGDTEQVRLWYVAQHARLKKSGAAIPAHLDAKANEARA